MKNSLILILFISLSYYSCEPNKKDTIQKHTKVDIYASKGYQLLEQKCYICHFEKPDPAKKDQMIAPPMLRVQEHYKPTYPDKEAFVTAVTNWVLNPQEEKTLMPGTIRKFNLMPKLPYEKKDIEIIAATIYDIDFGKMPHMKMKNDKLSLNDGQKWKVNANTLQVIEDIKSRLDSFNSNQLSDYNQLGNEIFDTAKTILLDKGYSKEMFDQLHHFFNSIEGNIHLLIGATNIDAAKKQQEILKKKFDSFTNYFE